MEALRQRLNESVTSFISRWREKIALIIDHSLERDHICMIMRSLQLRFAKHLMGFTHADFRSLVQALYDVEEGISQDGQSLALLILRERSHQEVSVQMCVLYLPLGRGRLDINSHFHKISRLILLTYHTLNTNRGCRFLHKLMIRLIYIPFSLSLTMLLRLLIHLLHTPSLEHLRLRLLTLLDYRGTFPSWGCH